MRIIALVICIIMASTTTQQQAIPGQRLMARLVWKTSIHIIKNHPIILAAVAAFFLRNQIFMLVRDNAVFFAGEYPVPCFLAGLVGLYFALNTENGDEDTERHVHVAEKLKLVPYACRIP